MIDILLEQKPDINLEQIKELIEETNEKIENRTISVYDAGGSIKVRLWDNLTHVIEDNQLKPGDLIQIKNCYVKSALNGKPIINIGEGGSISPYQGNDASIPDIDGITSNIDNIRSEKENVVVSGLISSIPRIIEFTDSRGEKKKSLQKIFSNEYSS